MKKKSLKFKKNKLHALFNVFLLFMALSGMSFAHFTAKINDPETVTTIVGDAGKMEINYVGGPNIVVAQMVPSASAFATKTFTVTGSSPVSSTLSYNVSIMRTKNTFTTNGLAYNLTSANTGSNGTVVPSSTKSMCYLLTGTGEEILGNGSFSGPTGGNKIHSYKLELYFPVADYQSANQNKSFEFSIKITEGTKTASTCRDLT